MPLHCVGRSQETLPSLECTLSKTRNPREKEAYTGKTTNTGQRFTCTFHALTKVVILSGLRVTRRCQCCHTLVFMRLCRGEACASLSDRSSLALWLRCMVVSV